MLTLQAGVACAHLSADVPFMTSADQRFNDLVLPEVEVMMRVAQRLTRRRADAEDLVQDALLRAYRAIDNFDGEYPRAWLLTIVRNTHINRNRRRRPELLRDPEVQMERSASAHSERGVPDQMVERTFDAEVEVALNKLSDSFRQAVQLIDIDGLPYAEAAAALGVPTGTVMSRVHRGRAKIRQHLDQVGIAPSYESVGKGDKTP